LRTSMNARETRSGVWFPRTEVGGRHVGQRVRWLSEGLVGPGVGDEVPLAVAVPSPTGPDRWAEPEGCVLDWRRADGAAVVALLGAADVPGTLTLSLAVGVWRRLRSAWCELEGVADCCWGSVGPDLESWG
jgi:hypothetical protein